MRLLILSFMLSLFWPIGAFSRTWYVRNDGTGDAPTIQAAVDSASSGDTVLVGPGTYSSANGWARHVNNRCTQIESFAAWLIVLEPNAAHS